MRESTVSPTRADVAGIDITRNADLLTARLGQNELAWDLARGGVLICLRAGAGDTPLLDTTARGAGADLVISVSERLEDEPVERHLSTMGQAHAAVFFTHDRQAARLEITTAGDGLRVERTITLRAGSNWVEERVALTNIGARDVLIDRYPQWSARGDTYVAGDLFHWSVNPGGVDYRLDGLRIGAWDEDEYVTPSCGYPWFYNRGRFAEMGETAVAIVGGHHGALLPCVMAYNAREERGVLLSCLQERSLTYLRMSADADERTGGIAAQVWWARWLSPHERQEVATFHLATFTGDYGRMLDTYRHWLAEERGITPPADAEAWIDDLFVGHLPSTLTHRLGDFRRLFPYIDQIAEVGCTVVWRGGTWLDACDLDPQVCMSRCTPVTRDGRYTAAPRYGGEEASAELNDYIHARGMKTAVWITGYGMTSFDPLFREHPDAFVRLRRPVSAANVTNQAWPGYDANYGRVSDWLYSPCLGSTVGGDTTHPAWRAYWLHNIEYWAGHGVDGVFFDSFNPMPPNYALRPWPGQISLEISHLQRAARRLAKAANPDFFSFTEGGGCYMATVNDLTYIKPWSAPPVLPPFRTAPLTPEEEARAWRDEALSLLPGGRAWATIEEDAPATRPGVLYTFFGGRMPVLPMYVRGVSDGHDNLEGNMHPNMTDHWQHWQPYPPEQPHPAEAAFFRFAARLWAIRRAHPELKSGTLDVWAVETSDRAVHAFLRRHEDDISVVALNFRHEAVACTVSVDLSSATVASEETLTPRDLLREEALPPCTGADLRRGYAVAIPPRDGIVVKLR
ncbi:MAG: hypothetical protein ACYC7E_09625 [Armatimonadota bacterium]